MPGSKEHIASTQQKAKEPVKPGPSGLPKWALPAVLAFTFLLYYRSLQNGITSFDDDFYLPKNPFLKDFSWEGIQAIFSSFYAGNYHPLTTLTYLFEYTKFGLDPFPYHLTNLLLHLVNTWLVFKLTERLSGKAVTGLVVCILFAIHPLHVESVAWVSERKDVLFTLFYLASLITYLRLPADSFQPKKYLWTLFLFTCSLLSKSAAVTLPVLLIAIDIYRGRKIDTRSLLEKIPFFLLSLLFGILNIMSQSAQGAMTDLGSVYNIVNRFFLFTSSLSFYFIKLVAPVHLSLLHFYPGVEHGALPWIYYLSLPLLLLIAWLVMKKHAYRKEVLFGVSFFLITISVMLQVLAVGSAIASERYSYVPYIGLFYIAGQWVAGTGLPKYRKLTIAVLSAVIVLCSVQTFIRIGIWKNDETLFGDVIKKDKLHSIGISQGFFQRGADRKLKGNIQGALDDFTQSALFCPEFANAHYNRALILSDQKDFKSAIPEYSAVIALNPKLSVAYNYRGMAYFQTGDTLAALQDLSKAIEFDTAYSEAYSNRGMIKYETHDIASSFADYYKAIALDHTNTTAYGDLAAIRANTHDLTGALNDYDSLLKYNPANAPAYATRAVVKYNLKDTAGACTDWRKAAEMGDKNAALMVGKYCQ